MYIKRDIEEAILEAKKSFQVITIYGSRQVGKTTTVNNLFSKSFNYVTLDDFDELNMALNAPKAFLEMHKWPLIIDEVQKAPNLLNQIKIIVDEKRLEWLRTEEKRELMYVLTGSNQFELQEGIAESLAGRTAILKMGSLTFLEKNNVSGNLFSPRIEDYFKKANPLIEKDVFTSILEGGMPDVVTGASNKNMYYESYITTYIEKDVKRLINADKELQFRNFLTLMALRSGQELNYGSISKDAGINVDTCKRWLSILETSGIIFLLEPYMTNVSKRIIKSPKVYFMDTGLLTHLCKIYDMASLKNSSYLGAIFETYVVSEVIKSFYNHNVDPKRYLYFYRDIDRKEIDLLYVDSSEIYPIEIKKGINPTKPNKNFSVLEKYNMKINKGLVIDNAETIRAINENVFVLPIKMIGL